MVNGTRWRLGAALLCLTSGALLGVRHQMGVAEAATAPRFTPSQLLDSNIVFYEANYRSDTTGGFALGQLAMLYMRRARETGSYDDVLRAEDAARHSLHNRGAHNTRARQMLAASLLSEHRFADALVVAQELASRDSSQLAFRAALAEVQMELGHYDSARVIFHSLSGETKNLSIAPRLARWAELEGRVDDAYALLDHSLVQVIDRRDVPYEQKAWFWLRMGDLQFRRGQMRDAQYAYEQGLEVHHDDYRLLAAMARLAAARQDWRQAIAYGDRAVGVSLDPATLGTISDAWTALGDTAKAAEYAHAMEVSVMRQPGAFHRAWGLFLLDHDRRVSEVLARAQDELRSRHDIYGWDLVAWALHHQGQDRAAREAMAHALSLGTRDAMLFFHAGMIDHALGDDAAARRELTEAMAINPYFHPTQPAMARAVLEASIATRPEAGR